MVNEKHLLIFERLKWHTKTSNGCINLKDNSAN